MGTWLDTDTTRLPQTVRESIVNWVIRDLAKRYQPRFCEVTDTLAISADDNDFDLPARFIQMHTLWYEHPESETVVFLDGPLSKEQFDLKFPDSSLTAYPSAYCIWGGEVLLGKTPEASFTLNRNYYQWPAALSGSGSNDFTEDHDDLVLFKSLVYAVKFGIEDERIPIWKETAEDLERDFSIHHARAVTGAKASVPQEPG